MWNRGDSPIICNCSMESAIILFFSETLTNLVGVNDYMEKFFKLKENKTTVSTEVMAGVTTSLQ